MSGPYPKEVERQLVVAATEPLSEAELPRVSIVILNWNGRHHLEPCFKTLREMDYPKDRFEVILIDNGSDDGSQAEMRAKHSWVKLIENERNTGFSAGCNQGAAIARDGGFDPEVLVFINNDIHVDKGFLRALVAPVKRKDAVATTAKMFSWDGKVLNSTGGGMNFHGIGIQRGYLRDPEPSYDVPRKTLFACGGAMAMDARLYFEVGGFDEEFFAYYEDVDLGWRTWVMGHEVRYVPSAICYHHHSSTSGRVPIERLRVLQIRNPQLACFKNYDDENLRKILPAMLGLGIRRAFISSAMPDQGNYRIEAMNTLGSGGAGGRFWRRIKKNLDTHDQLGRIAIADLLGINDLLGRWDYWMARRKVIQDQRRTPDSEILPLFLRPMWCIEGEPGYQELQSGMADFFGLDELFEGLTTMPDEPPA
ncbi:N-acetylglucosaminyl-diphospho-decaprenol L-rhamnosyltransferase [Planctomycetes bacterium Poly30]|uniref:N-acetylglucosaminyl-diphospho-decaprenol L-rhamnosyltransferase n=1 Tax=Saltatorellus ferox TaxID=2528018 RepID=A0A518ES85_9BACT|nr:N-acetylglucosaminyl-diphospho-decaprenol L-rhamnosyltransferase [Planctomycetes bacterium Poly30]